MRIATPNLTGWSGVSHHAGAPGSVHVHVICLPDWQPLSAYCHTTAYSAPAVEVAVIFCLVDSKMWVRRST